MRFKYLKIVLNDVKTAQKKEKSVGDESKWAKIFLNV